MLTILYTTIRRRRPQPRTARRAPAPQPRMRWH
jgi:hypothetical protein